MSLVFNGVETNKVMWNGIETKGILNGNVIWGIEEPTFEEWVNLGSTEYKRAGGSSSTVHNTFTGMPSTSNFNYITFIFDASLTGSSGGAADIYLENSSNGSIWRMRAHYQQTYPGFVGIQGGVTAWTTDSSAPSIGSYTLNSVSYRYCSSKWTRGNYARFKIVFDRNNKIGYLYISGTLLGYVTLNVDPITIQKFGLLSEQGRSYEIAALKNIKVAGFKNLTDAQNWS